MKIINRESFLKMPKGIVYSKFEPCVFGDLSIKDESLENDWFYQDIIDAIDVNDSGEFGEVLCRAEETGESMPMDFNCVSRDGCFDEDQLFAVWEKKDLAGLIEKLNKTLWKYLYNDI